MLTTAVRTMTTKRNDKLDVEELVVTPEMAVAFLEANKHNRPLNDQHVKRLCRQIVEDKWIVNGDSIKFADTGDVLDGQHRLWAVIYAKLPIRTLVVRGVPNRAFNTIDTLRKTRSAADMLYLRGMTKYRQVAAGGLMWLVRYERGIIEDWKAPQNRIENSDVERAFERHSAMAHAAERAAQLRYVHVPTMLAFVYYVIAQQNESVANRMMDTLNDSTDATQDDPFFLLRAYMIARAKKPKDPVMTIALTFKAANAVARRRKLQALLWRRQGAVPEPFPLLELKG